MKYLVTGYSKIEFQTMVEASSEDEALKAVGDREIVICIHGTEMADGEVSQTDWVYSDAPDFVDPSLAEIQD